MHTAKQQNDFFWSCKYAPLPSVSPLTIKLVALLQAHIIAIVLRENILQQKKAAYSVIHMFYILKLLPLHSLIMYWKSVYVYGM